MPHMEKLRYWFELTGTTQGQLAAEIGVTRQTVSNWLTGRTFPSGLELRKLSEITRIPLEDLVPKK
jgi:transcriptional regulator with XRE-family HTH domain